MMLSGMGNVDGVDEPPVSLHAFGQHVHNDVAMAVRLNPVNVRIGGDNFLLDLD